MTAVEIRAIRFGAPVAQQMVAAAQQELTQRYGSGDASPIESIEFDPPEGSFFVAWLDGQPVGCGGWRTAAHFADIPGGEEVAEIKRMFVSAEARNAGIATAILRALEESAAAAGKRRMILETGLLQPEAIALYTKLGYEKIPNYGHYKDEPECVSFGRDL